MNSKITKFLLLIILFFSAQNLFAQSNIAVMPGEIKFENPYQRLKTLIIKNNGTSDLKIDSIQFNKDLFTLRYGQNLHLPIFIAPNDTISFDFILSNYYSITSNEIKDSLTIYSNDPDESVKNIKIEIGFSDDSNHYGMINGTVQSQNVPLDSVKINFYYERQYLIKSVYTNSNGQFESMLPTGEYTIAAEKNGYEVQFYRNKSSFCDANEIQLGTNSPRTLDFDLAASIDSSNKVTGLILDQLTGAPLNTGLVIIRKGIHTPNKVSGTNSSDIYAGFIRQDGTFTINNVPNGYYFIQAFSNLYIPAYYSPNGSYIFWNNPNVDSIRINSDMHNINISLPRDSAYGAGSITGSVGSTIGNLDYTKVIIFAKNTTSNSIFSYSLVDSAGNFSINNLPFNNYTLIAQSIGLNDALSQSPTIIDSVNLNVSTSTLTFTSVVDVKKESSTLPNTIQLYQNYPNPFNPSTTISFFIPKSADVSIKVYNIIGKEVADLSSGFMERGNHKLTFNASGLTSGVYFVYLRSSGVSLVKKMILLK